MMSIKLPLWLRFVLLVGIVGLVSGASLLAYRYWTRPVTLSVAVGSIDGEAAKAMSAIASRLASNNAAVRLNVVDSGTAPRPFPTARWISRWSAETWATFRRPRPWWS